MTDSEQKLESPNASDQKQQYSSNVQEKPKRFVSQYCTLEDWPLLPFLKSRRGGRTFYIIIKETLLLCVIFMRSFCYLTYLIVVSITDITKQIFLQHFINCWTFHPLFLLGLKAVLLHPEIMQDRNLSRTSTTPLFTP